MAFRLGIFSLVAALLFEITASNAQEAAPGAVPSPAPLPPAALPPASLPHDLSPLGMFLAADIVVKAVMVGLAIASLITWTVWFSKSMQLATARIGARRALKRLDDAASLKDAAGDFARGRGPFGEMVRAAVTEAQLSIDATAGLKERVASRLQRIEARAARQMAVGTGLLATIGSTAPFVGLFGTVWGIMNAFIGISAAKTTNLAIVAPGIAEALLATAIGLVAAIPAVVIYNVFARQIAAYRALVTDASAAIQRLVSRDLDRHAPALPAETG